MSFVWRDYLKIAEELKDHSEESYNRTAISRAYYACFHIAKNRITFRDITPNVHTSLCDKLEKSDLANHRVAGAILKGLRIKRNNADYDLSPTQTKQKANDVYAEALEFLDQLDPENDEYV